MNRLPGRLLYSQAIHHMQIADVLEGSFPVACLLAKQHFVKAQVCLFFEQLDIAQQSVTHLVT